MEIFYDDDYDYSKITYRKVNNENMLETTYFSGCKDFDIINYYSGLAVVNCNSFS